MYNKNNKRFKVEITNFEKNRVYEIKTSNKRESIITRYELVHIDLENTKLILLKVRAREIYLEKSIQLL